MCFPYNKRIDHITKVYSVCFIYTMFYTTKTSFSICFLNYKYIYHVNELCSLLHCPIYCSMKECSNKKTKTSRMCYLNCKYIYHVNELCSNCSYLLLYERVFQKINEKKLFNVFSIQ